MPADAVKQHNVNLPTRRDAIANRERVLAAAREVFGERGVDAEVREIAERAGVGVGTVYRNFPSKEALIDGLVNQFIDELRPAFDEAVANDDPIAGLSSLLRQAMISAESFGNVLNLITLMTGERPQTVDHARDELKEQAIRVFQRGVEKGVFRDDVSPEFMTMFIEVAMPDTYIRLRETYTAEEAREGAVRMLVGAATARPNEQSRA